MPLLIANWKMYGDTALCDRFCTAISANRHSVTLVVAPCMHLLAYAAQQPHLTIAAQNCFAGDSKEGAYTGEVSAAQLQETGIRYCIIGHSERRQYYQETDARVAQKLRACLESHLTPVLCIGENLSQYEAHATHAIITNQLDGALSHTTPTSLVIAYEPVWAIGSGRTPTFEEIHAALDVIATWCRAHLPNTSITLLYGGSVKLDNIGALWEALTPLCSGFLVGSASLNAENFIKMAALLT